MGGVFGGGGLFDGGEPLSFESFGKLRPVGDPLLEHDAVDPDTPVAASLGKPVDEVRELYEQFADDGRGARTIVPLDVLMRQPSVHHPVHRT